jgi:hypothetical protein
VLLPDDLYTAYNCRGCERDKTQPAWRERDGHIARTSCFVEALPRTVRQVRARERDDTRHLRTAHNRQSLSDPTTLEWCSTMFHFTMSVNFASEVNKTRNRFSHILQLVNARRVFCMVISFLTHFFLGKYSNYWIKRNKKLKRIDKSDGRQRIKCFQQKICENSELRENYKKRRVPKRISIKPK